MTIISDKFMKKFYCFAVICVYAFAFIGGFAYLLADGRTLFAIADVALAAMAFPYVYARVKELLA